LIDENNPDAGVGDDNRNAMYLGSGASMPPGRGLVAVARGKLAHL
jgi:hypothetical protein